MRLKSGNVWTGMLLHGGHNPFGQAFFDAQTGRARIIRLCTTEFGAGLALIAVIGAVIFYAKRGQLPAHCESESALQTSSISPAAA